MATVRKRTLPSGKVKWQAGYIDGHGKRRAKMFDRKGDADAWLVKVRHDVSRGLHVADSQSITVAEAGKLWIERAEREGLERSTLRQYTAHLTHHILPELGAIKLSSLTAPRVHAFADRMIDTRSRAMGRKVIRSLGSLVDEAVARGLAAHNPVRSVKIRTPTREQAEIEMPSREELRAIIAGASGRWSPLILTAIFTGLRGSELRGLRWEDVDLKAGVLKVRRRADPWGAFGPPKSKAGRRDIPLAPMALNALKEWKLACPQTEHDLVFPSPKGRVLPHAMILKDVFWPLQVEAGVVGADGEPKYSLHALRHAAAALFIDQGMSPKRIQALMGHASITMTYDVYGYLFPADGEDHAAMAAIEAKLLK